MFKPSDDLVFKMIFTGEDGEELLIDLINAILGLKGPKAIGS